MAGAIAAGALRCQLAPGVRLVRRGTAAWVVAPDPLRVWRVQPAALELLAHCRAGRTVGEAVAAVPGLRPAVALRLLDRLAEQGAVQLEPVGDAAALPSVSVVIPVRNRPRAIAACLAAIERLDYPRDRLEVIVVDDGSTDATPEVVAAWAGRLPLRLIRLPAPAGQAAGRNRGAAAARGEVLAFTDSDCLPTPGWLRELVPELALPGVAAVGGAVLPAEETRWLQRYEAVRSPLFQGVRRASVRPRAPVAYLASCNLLVRRRAFRAVGGFAELPVGEDVDLIWRLCARGARVQYRPDGAVRHDHRDRLGPFLRRRAAYGGSEALLLERHPENGRYLVVPMGLALGLGWALAGLATRRARLAPLGVVPPAIDLALAVRRTRRAGLPVEPSLLLRAALRGYGAALYWGAVNVSRYYAIPALAVSLAAGRSAPGRGLRLAVGLSLLGTAVVDWVRLGPRLPLPHFVAAHALDALAYHLGSLAGCARHRTLRPLRLQLVPRWPAGRAPEEPAGPTRPGRR
ncbi:MAG: mycofactocin biosynthesis glycosyltransferase MftF [Sphaerobacter sp.]|nr:mycofactocin biosynthesis glycosyltransferase MftF [Sphaerobacter sp.]